jgi:uncharacterized DUF497 family protein
MEFEWDENKRMSNIEKHGFDFRESWKLFDGDHIKGVAKQGKCGEERFLATGLIDEVYATIICTMRNGIYRVISLRKARPNEQRKHQALHGE